MSSSRLKEFVRHAFKKVKLALAFHIIINTPPEKTAEEYARELQNAFIKLLIDNEDPLLSKRLALYQKKQTEAHQHSSIIPNLTDKSRCFTQPLGTGTSLRLGQPTDPDSGYNSCDIVDGGVSKIDDGKNCQTSSELAEYETPLNFSEDVQKTLSANLDFVRGLIRLQDLAEKDDDDLHLQQTGAVSHKTGPNKVLGGVIQYALQSSNTEATVTKSVQEILRHLCGIALTADELPCAILNWEGSLLQHSMAIIRKLSDDKPFQQAIVQATGRVATILITDMLTNYSIEKNMKVEYQATLLLQLCGSIPTCSEVLNTLINMIANTSVAISKFESTTTPIDRTSTFESCFFSFHLTEKLLIRYFTLWELIDKPPKVDPSKLSKEANITEVWRSAWDKKDGGETHQNVPDQQSSDSTNLLLSWKTNLQKAAKVLSNKYPLMTIYANNCLILTSPQQKNQTNK